MAENCPNYSPQAGVVFRVCLPKQYEKTVVRKSPDPPSQVMEWVYRDNLDYLDLAQYHLELLPGIESAPRNSNNGRIPGSRR